MPGKRPPALGRVLKSGIPNRNIARNRSGFLRAFRIGMSQKKLNDFR
jgi:hypothetical protein